MNHNKIAEESAKFLKLGGKRWTCPVVFVGMVASTRENPDVLGFYSGGSTLVEAKASRSDFLRDKKKKHRISPETGMGLYRFYSCPPKIIMKKDLPKKWGLIYIYENGQAKMIVQPQRFSNRNISAEMRYMYSGLRRKYVGEYEPRKWKKRRKRRRKK